METKEFSELLVKARENRGLSRYALGLQMGMTDAHLRRVELALHNYNLKKVFEYLNAINCCLYIAKGKKVIALNSEQECVEWIIKTRKNLTQYALAKLAKISQPTLIKIEEQRTTSRIDTFLKIIEALGYKIDKIC